MKNEERSRTQATLISNVYRRGGLFSALALWMLILPAGLLGQDFIYVTSNGEIAITGYLGPGGAVTIPAVIDDLPVTSIEYRTFYDRRTLLTSVTIPYSVTRIDIGAAHDCTNLIEFNVDPLNPSFSSLEGVLFDNSQTALIQCPRGKSGSYTIPNSVSTIGYLAFYSCNRLANITIGNGVTSLGNTAFGSCTSLTNVTIPNSVNIITDWAFSDCTSLTDVDIPNSVTNIDGYAFSQCRSLTTVTIPDSVTTIGVGAFAWSSLTNLVIGNSVKTICDYAFYACTNLTVITAPLSNTITSIGEWAFSSCTSLTDVAIGNSVTNIGGYAFSQCTSLATVTIPNRVTSIQEATFLGCSSLSNVTIPNSITNIEKYAFSSCTSLSNVTIPNSVSKIGEYAFSSCATLSTIRVDTNNPAYSSEDEVLFNKDQTTLIQYPQNRPGASCRIPNSVTSIGSGAFSYCAGLTNIMIPSRVTTIGEYAFSYCTSLPSVTIPKSVATIGRCAFRDCISLTSVIIPNSVTSIGYGAFLDCINLTDLYFEGNAPSLGDAAFANTANATVYRLPGTTGWEWPFFGDRPTALWVLPNPVILNSGPSFGVQSNAFGFIISWATNVPVVVEACTDLVSPTWSPLSTNTLTDGWSYFSDSQWANYPARFYRLRSP